MSISGFSQKTIVEYEKSGDRLMERGKFLSAADSYAHALAFDSTQAKICYKYAKALARSYNYCKAIAWYKNCLNQGDTATFPNAIYELGVAQKGCGKYEDALKSFNRAIFLSNTFAELGTMHTKILNEISSVQFAISHQSDSLKYYIQQLPEKINTVNSEFNPVPLPGNRLVFSSYKTLYADSFSNIFSTFYTSNIMEARQTQKGWSTAKSFDTKINSNRWFTANICFDKRYRKAIFARCYDNNGQIGQCMLFMSEKKNGKWTKAKKLPSPINLSNFTSTQPFLVEMQDFDILYYVSNRTGGYGGMDIWYSIIKEGKFQEPVNLGKVINTRGDELTPYYEAEKQVLFFSSNWHESFGGYDIFQAYGGLSQWEKPINMGIPINSENNDLYYTPINNASEAYFSSNRLGARTRPGADYCCSDIYWVSTEKQKVNEDMVDTSFHSQISLEEQIQKLLPIALYFDNDQPNPNSLSDTTSFSYKSLLDTYTQQMTKYQRKYGEGLDSIRQQIAADSIEVFFQDYVLGGYERLNMFLNLLREELSHGKTVTLVIKGYASPLNTANYNYQLSKRRIASLINYLHTAQNGFFIPYLKGSDSLQNKIIIYEDPRGDSNAAQYVSDNPNDKRNSIYSMSAARERRIQIVMYNSGDTLQASNEVPEIVFQKHIGLGVKTKRSGVIKGSFEIGNQGNSELLIHGIDSDSIPIQFQPEKLTVKTGTKSKIYFLIKTDNLDSDSYKIPIRIKSNLEKTELFYFEFSLE
jgi:tetratricopeptide (TPR) repeat protein